MNEFQRVAELAAAIRERGLGRARLVVVLGSGLGRIGDMVQDPLVARYEELPGFPTPSVSGHAGRLVEGELGGVRVVIMQGRVHTYEGYSAAQVVRPLRALIHGLGMKGVLLTNAAGGVSPHFEAGDLMLICDHINLTGANPMIGPMDERWPVRFVDLTQAWDLELSDAIEEVARRQDLPLRRGIYAGMMGASYETPSEIRMVHTLGADAVGMSTVHEVIAARHLRARVAGVSCITNLAAGLGKDLLSHEEVKETAARVEPLFVSLLLEAIPLLDRVLASSPSGERSPSGPLHRS